MKRDILASVCNLLGFTRFLEILPRRNCLVCLNYHRIGISNHVSDPGLFSSSVEQFEEQVRFIKKRYAIVSLEEATEFIKHPSRPGTTCVLLTFDDGYLDNYQIAYPILRSQGVSATFFLVSSFVGNNKLPWWDLIAWILGRTNIKSFNVDYPIKTHINMEENGYEENLRTLLKNYKSYQNQDSNKFIKCLREACHVYDDPSSTNRLFMNWDEVREIRRGGMCIGSHTHSHEILAKLPLKKQVEEIAISKAIIEEKLHERVNALAYPNGDRSCFSVDTYKALHECGYKIAFSYYGGVNLPGKTSAFDVRRMAIESNMPINNIRLSIITSAQSGRDVSL